MELRTTEREGLIFFISDGKDGDYCFLQIMSGFVMFVFDNGGGRQEMVTDFVVDDGNWHTVSTGIVWACLSRGASMPCQSPFPKPPPHPIKNGIIMFVFDNVGGRQEIVTDFVMDDGNWHKYGLGFVSLER